MRNWLFSKKIVLYLLPTVLLLLIWAISVQSSVHMDNYHSDSPDVVIEKELPDINDKEVVRKRNQIDTIYKEEIELNQMTITDEEEFLFVSTSDGYIHAYSNKDTAKELWKISLGKELTTTNIISSSIIEEQSALIPMDGIIYLYSNESGEKNIQKFNAPIEKLIENAPFTLGFMPDYIFLGDKRSTMFTIDVQKGLLVAKYSANAGANEERSSVNSHPIQSQNLLTVIRIDYTLICLQKETHSQVWNVTVSDVLAIQKGSKSEISLKHKDGLIGAMNKKQRELDKQLESILDKSHLDKTSIVSVHTYNDHDSIPIKIYNRADKINEDEILAHLLTMDDPNEMNNEHKLIMEYLHWKREKMKKEWYETNTNFLNELWVKLIEMYKFDSNFFGHCVTFSLMFILLIGSITLTLRYRRKNKILADRVRKLSDENKICRSDASPGEIQTVVKYIPSPLSIKAQEPLGKNDNLIMDAKNADLLFTSPLDLRLSNYEQGKELNLDMRIYQDSNGTYVQEEKRTMKTKYVNHPEVEAKFKKIQRDMQGDEDFKGKKQRTYSFQNFDEECLNYSSEERPRSTSGRSSSIKIDGKLSIFAVKNKGDTQVYLKKENTNSSSLRKYDYFQSKQKSKEIQVYKPSVKDKSELNDRSPTKTPPSSGLINHPNLAAFIDEGRLDKNFEDIAKIGQGGFGCVFKARHRIDSNTYAIKLIELKIGKSQNLMDHKVIKEVKTMIKLNHKNVVRYITCWFQLAIDSLSDMIDKSTLMSESNTKLLSECNGRSIRPIKKFVISQTNNSLLEITENEESSSIRTKSKHDQGFNWDETESNHNLTSDIVEFVKPSQQQTSKPESNLQSDNNTYDPYASSEPEEICKVYFFIQMEYCDGMPLNQFIEFNKENGLERRLIYTFFKQIVNGVRNIHMNNIIHRDLKPHNIFIMGKDSLKIGDFGLATELDLDNRRNRANVSQISSSPRIQLVNQLSLGLESAKLSEMVGTPMYQSPEQIEGKLYNEKVDVYAMGLILYEMCACFKTGMERSDKMNRLRNEHVVDVNVQERFPIEMELVRWMTKFEPKERPSAEEIINSELFNKMG